MPFKKGKSGNPSGRKPGAKNKIGQDLREMIADFLSSRFINIVEDFDDLPPQEKHKVYTSLLPYCIGKKQDLTLENQLGKCRMSSLMKSLTY
ncbi:MAG: hypothetical protein IPP46_12745 [Bacteroidetes bacterium]|nr:hypothetical protein [Bacteroidota bacterium]